MDLQSGQNVALGAGRLSLTLSATPPQQQASLDLCAFMLDANGKVTGDTGFVFYGQPRAPSGAVTVDPATGVVTIDPRTLPAGIERVVIAVSIDSTVAGLDAFRRYQGLVLEGKDDRVSVRFALSTTGMAESALILAEVYVRNGTWKIRALGQGFAGGLAPLARNYGVDVGEQRPPAPPKPAPAPPKPAAPPPPAARGPVDLTKRKPISLEKPATGYGEININLNWARGKAKKGFFGGSSAAIDLDLGCMVEFNDGYKNVVQALGKSFGELGRPPHAQLLGDDRSGDSNEGETLLINGAQWARFKRVLIYTFIYEGAPDWATANAVVTITAPGTQQLRVHLDEPGSGKGMCAIAMLENDSGRIRVTKLIDYFAGHQPMDRHFGFGFNWKAGSK
ncbi:MAG: tellurium resistance protein TerA [Sphingobacteriia bacterium]|jgi:tellurite resistance protein TerA|nr:tellurium resistance protein TerA [Sphingobacteriia bacterium]